MSKQQASPTVSDAILPSLTLVDDRIVTYEAKLRQWQEFSKDAGVENLGEEQQQKIAACQQQMQNILTGYNELHELLLEASSGSRVELSPTEKLVAVERQDLSFLENECQQILKVNQETGGWLAGTKSRLIQEKEKEIAEAMNRDDYALVIALYEQMPQAMDQEISIETVYSYGKALLRTGNAQQASTVLQNLLTRIRQAGRIEQEFDIMKLVADISFGLEDYKRAFERYVDIINRYAGLGDNVEWARQQQTFISARGEKGTEVNSFAELMLSYLTYNPDTDGYKTTLLARNFTENYPDSPLNATASRIYMESMDKADAWFASVLKQVERLRAEKKYAEALTYIEQLPRAYLLPEKLEQLKALTDEMISVQFEEAEKLRQAQEQELEETWNNGLAHMRAKEYDKAIEVFTSLLETPYGDRARMQIEEAAQLTVQENRRKAAELFVRANRTTDLNTKIELLLESRRLLQDILVKYPQSDLADKVKRNMSRIEEEIIAIDPNLLNSTAGGQFSDGGQSSSELPSAVAPAPVPEDDQDYPPSSNGND